MKLVRRVPALAVAFAFAAATAVVAHAASTPGPPMPPITAAPGNAQVTVSWGAAQTGGSPIAYYTVSWTGATNGTQKTSGGNQLSLTITGLTNGSPYTFSITATNTAGPGPAVTVMATPQAPPPPPSPSPIPPGPPSFLTAKAGDQQVVLSWGPPGSSGSKPIDHYTVTVTPGGQSLQTKATSATVAGLTNQTAYTFTVTATNQDLQTGPAASASATPSPPPFLTLVPAFGPGDAKITVSGHQFTASQAITLDWDGDQTVVVGSAQADATGSFNVDIRPPTNPAAGPHKICVTVDPQPCGNFTVTGPTGSPSPAPSPTPSPSPSPTTSSNPSPSSSPSPAPTLTGFDIISRPPFVFLPILAVLALLGAIAFWIFGRRPPPSLPSATVMHRSVRPEAAAPVMGAATPPAAVAPEPPPPPAPHAPELPAPESPPQPAPPPPPPPSAPDEPPDLPEPGE